MRLLHKVDPDFWWDVAQKCPYATFFHTPLWNEIARWYNPNLRDRSIGLVTENGTRAVFPLLETKRIGPFRHLTSTFEGTYGGLIADGPLDCEQVQAIYHQLNKWFNLSLYYLANPLAPSYPIEKDLVFDWEVTHMIHLEKDFELTFQRFKKNTRTDYRRGLREGARVRRADLLDDYQAYYVAYTNAIERWGQTSDYGYRWELFEKFFELARQHPEQITVWVVELDDKVVGGSVTFHWHRHVTAWHAAVQKEAMKRKAMVVLDTEITRDAIARNYDYYDLNTSAKIDGLINYKRSFGAVDHPIARYKHDCWLLKPALRYYRKFRYGNEYGDAYVGSPSQ